MTEAFVPHPYGHSSPPPIRRRLRVRGIVQGVGFRPYVYTLATQLALGGFVGNDSSGVFIEIEGPAQVLDRFQRELQEHAPPLALIEQIDVTVLPLQGDRAFVIVASHAAETGMQRTFVPPDQALCADCRRELFDPEDRRSGYPFINCTNCGPRFTIIQGTPYDRPLTTMRGFAMCEDCRHEYDDPRNRRFHAQPIACPVCGPQLTFLRRDSAGDSVAVDNPPAGADATTLDRAAASRIRTQEAIVGAQDVLRRGEILAVKGLGGFHLACDAGDDRVVAQLRTRKGRVDKPFAVMAANLAAVQRIAELDDAEAELLACPVRPIVLLRKRQASGLAPAVAPGNGYVGVMLPYTPLHELLFSDLGTGQPPDVLVMTSGNLSEEPITWRDEDALARLGVLADAFLLHDRPIYAPCDDTVVRVFAGGEFPIRRARGYAPMPLTMPAANNRSAQSSTSILATGADLKAVFCLTQGSHAILSQHIGDMGNLETYDAFSHAVNHLQKLFRVEPEVLVCDAHPHYLTTRWAHEHARGRPVLTVQHHHAHLAAVLAEHGAAQGVGDEPVIGFCFDGTGYGMDGAIWGGEVLVGSFSGFERRAHLRYIPLPGGDAAVRRPYRVALAHLWAAGVEWHAGLPPVQACTTEEAALLRRQLTTGLQCVPTSSVGRLCDAVAAIAGVCQVAGYEAQAAIELESRLPDNIRLPTGEPYQSRYRFDYVADASAGSSGQSIILLDPGTLIRRAAADVLGGKQPAYIAAQFHAALVQAILDLSLDLRRMTGCGRVALSGGVFQNVALLRGAVTTLREAGFAVLLHRRVPPNDGGLALGQAAIAMRQLQPM